MIGITALRESLQTNPTDEYDNMVMSVCNLLSDVIDSWERNVRDLWHGGTESP